MFRLDPTLPAARSGPYKVSLVANKANSLPKFGQFAAVAAASSSLSVYACAACTSPCSCTAPPCATSLVGPHSTGGIWTAPLCSSIQGTVLQPGAPVATGIKFQLHLVLSSHSQGSRTPQLAAVSYAHELLRYLVIAAPPYSLTSWVPNPGNQVRRHKLKSRLVTRLKN